MILEEMKKVSSSSNLLIEHRLLFQKFKNIVVGESFHQINPKELHREYESITKQLNNCQDDDSIIDEFEELAFYQERYSELQKFLAQRTGAKTHTHLIDKQDLISNFQKNFNLLEDDEVFQDKRRPKTEQLKQSNSLALKASQQKPFTAQKQTSSKQNEITGNIHSFFEKKQKDLRRIGFKDLIDRRENSSHSASRFKKKPRPVTHDVQVKKLLQQNKRLHQQLERKSKEDNELNQFQKNVLKEQKERCMKRIEQLEEEVEQLSRNNYKLKEIEKQKKYVSTFVNDSLRENNEKYLPYQISVRTNNLQKISKNNKSPGNTDQKFLEGIEDIPPIHIYQPSSFYVELEKINAKPFTKNEPALQKLLDGDQQRSPANLFQGPTQMKWNSVQNLPLKKNIQMNVQIEPQSRFQSFSMAQTAYNNSSLFLNASKNIAAIDSVTSTRNKVAFFKQSLVIVRDESYDIAFKRSEIDFQMQRVRLIFYINNKTFSDQLLQTEYDYQLSHFIVETTEKASQINAKSQGRQVIEVTLSSSATDLNSVIDAHFNIGDKRYDLWVPVCFIEWTSRSLTDSAPRSNMVVQPDRQFCKYENLYKLVPLSQPILTRTDEEEAFLYGRSKFGNHEIKLTWWQKELTIECSDLLIDFLGFIMHHFK